MGRENARLEPVDDKRILVCFGAPRAIVRLGTCTHNRRMPIRPRGVAACVRCRRAAQRSVWCGRSVARAGGGGASNPRGTAPRTVWRGVRRRIGACCARVGTRRRSRHVVRSHGRGRDPPLRLLAPPRDVHGGRTGPRERDSLVQLARRAQGGGASNPVLARVFRPSPRVVASPDFVADASVPSRSSRLISRAATSARAR